MESKQSRGMKHAKNKVENIKESNRERQKSARSIQRKVRAHSRKAKEIMA